MQDVITEKRKHLFVKNSDTESNFYYMGQFAIVDVKESEKENSREDFRELYGKPHPTAAGMLMFGDEYNIVRQFPEYFLDYREMLDPVTRWTDRLQSSSGEWSGNVFDFYYRVYNKIIKDIKVPFKTVKGTRLDNNTSA